MSNTEALRAAAQAVLDRWDSPQWEWTKHGPTADLMHELRQALAQQPAASGEPAEPWGYAVLADGWRLTSKQRYDAALANCGPKWAVPVYTAPQPAPAPTLEALHAATIAQQHRVPYALVQDIAKALGAQPAPAPLLKWIEAPRRTEWGAGMMEALIALGPDEMLRLYAHQDAVPMADALLSAQPAPARVPHGPIPAKPGPVLLNGALVICEQFDREPCPHQPHRRCGDCPGLPTTPAQGEQK